MAAARGAHPEGVHRVHRGAFRRKAKGLERGRMLKCSVLQGDWEVSRTRKPPIDFTIIWSILYNSVWFCLYIYLRIESRMEFTILYFDCTEVDTVTLALCYNIYFYRRAS